MIDSPLDASIVNDLEVAIARNVAIVLLERSSRPVERLSELIAQEAAGSPAARPIADVDLAFAEEIASPIRAASRAAVLTVLRAKPPSSSKALVSLAEALNGQQHQSLPKASTQTQVSAQALNGQQHQSVPKASTQTQVIREGSQKVMFTTEVMPEAEGASRHSSSDALASPRASLQARHSSPAARAARRSSATPPQKSAASLEVLRKVVADPRHRIFKMMDSQARRAHAATKARRALCLTRAH